MSTPTETKTTSTVERTGTESEQQSRLRRYDQRVEEWLASLKEGAEQRSPEVLSALSAKAKDVADYLDKLAEKTRARSELSGAAPVTPPSPEVDPGNGDPAPAEVGGYSGPDPEADPKGDGSDEDQGT